MVPAAVAVGAVIAFSATMVKAVALAKRFAALPRPVLLIGESGVGKGLLARFIHAHSGRPGDFVALTGGELSESLLQDQLAGHEAGAFTGAQRRVRGAFERAQGGTLFLDELPLWSRTAQSAVLRAVDDGVITRLGGERDLTLNTRLVFASNRPLQQLVDEGRLLPDLRWRIRDFVVEVPALAGRFVDIAALGYQFLDAASHEFAGRGPVLIDPEALEQLLVYHWPGNVRQLRSAVEFGWVAAADEGAERIHVHHLPSYLGENTVAHRVLDKAARHDLSVWAFDRTGHDRRRAADLLGLHPNTIDHHRREATA
jgi:DNA-binding NtrC family response regulator